MESIDHIIGGYSLMSPTDYKHRHDNVANILNMELAFYSVLLDKEKAVPYLHYILSQFLQNVANIL